MLAHLSGATRVYFILGHPITQVMSPAGVTRAFASKARDAVMIPIDVAPADFATFVAAASIARNVDGLLITVPHKFAAFGHCSTATHRARALAAVNAMRRNEDGSWHGDMTDGSGFLRALEEAGAEPAGARALLVGAGGAGGAIGLALIDAGVMELAIHDQSTERRDALIHKLRETTDSLVTIGSRDPSAFTIVANATPLGMRADDPLPVATDALAAGAVVGDVVTYPEITPLIAAARARGCRTATGVDMFNAQRDLLAEFLLGDRD
ncbi:MAG: shikimate dehydrogenase [Proteobacteria bacterium]|nr:shikimate dehydrogenase [Pseudomonadota bacterium]